VQHVMDVLVVWGRMCVCVLLAGWLGGCVWQVEVAARPILSTQTYVESFWTLAS
jgi:hypothetical protein